MGTLGNFKTDLKKAHEEGVETELMKGFFVTIARSNNPNYTSYLQQNLKGRAKRIARQEWGALLEAKPILKKACALTIVKGWRGMTDKDNNEIPYSEDKAVEILTDPEYEDLYDAIMDAAGDETLYRQEGFEEDAGN